MNVRLKKIPADRPEPDDAGRLALDESAPKRVDHLRGYERVR